MPSTRLQLICLVLALFMPLSLVADARVTVLGTTLLVTTPANGAYSFDSVAAGRHTVEVRRVGYALARREVEIGAGATVEADVPLRAAPVSLAAIVVTGSGAPAERKVLGNTIGAGPA